MDFWARLLGTSTTTKKPAPTKTNDPQNRFARFKRVLTTIQQLCNRPRNIALEVDTLEELRKLFERLALLIREETRAPAPHLCLQYAASHQIYTIVNRAAAVSFHEGCIHAAVSLTAALIDSEEEDFLSSAPFAKSLMRLVTRVVDGGNVLLSIETETAVLELLFTIAAKIRLQPDILPSWFAATTKSEVRDGASQEKTTSFVGLTSKDDFPLCYLLIDRVHHEGRIGDFARTGLLYIFEATGRSSELEEWIVSSDLPTLMGSGLGALYSQLSRELSILHPDATLPAILAMSDYSTTHHRADAESAFSPRHQAHMNTFLSYLAFWQDILDHCKSPDVKDTLLDHFQVLFLRQLLYPSILQSSDTDAGSSIAVLTYLTAMIEALEYPDLIRNLLTYLLAISEPAASGNARAVATNDPPAPRSPATLKRKESLLLLAASRNSDDAVEPILFNMIDLIQTSLASNNAQTLFAALKLTSTIVARQKKYVFNTMLKVEPASAVRPIRSLGAFRVEVDQYWDLAVQLHDTALDDTYTGLAEDIRLVLEAQVPLSPASTGGYTQSHPGSANGYRLLSSDAFIHTLLKILKGFFTNSIDVNLALTQALTSIACCIEIRPDGWLCLEPSSSSPENEAPRPSRKWQSHLDQDEQTAWSSLQQAAHEPTWPSDNPPQLYSILTSLAKELQSVRDTIPTLDQLIDARKNMLQAASTDATLDGPQSPPGSPSASNKDPSSPNEDRRARSSLDVISGVLAHEIYQPPPADTPSTTDILMQKIAFPPGDGEYDGKSAEIDAEGRVGRSASLNHVLTNVVVLQEFVLELVAVLQVRAAVLGEAEIRFK